jgi:hypothetical protein
MQIVLPALATLYFAIGSTWGLPHVESVVATMTAVATFLGVTLGISGLNFNKDAITVNARPDGTLNLVRQDDGTILYDFDANETFAKLVDKAGVVFKINKDQNV